MFDRRHALLSETSGGAQGFVRQHCLDIRDNPLWLVCAEVKTTSEARFHVFDERAAS